MNLAEGLHREPPTVVDLVRHRILDAELAALVWLLLDARTPLFVAGLAPSGPAGRAAPAGRPGVAARTLIDRRLLLHALLGLLPPEARRIQIDPSGAGLERLTSSDAAAAWLTDLDLGPAPAFGVRLAFRSLSRGAVMAASVGGDSLEDVFARLRGPDIRLSDDEISFLGLVLIIRAVESPTGGSVDRVAAAHYVRPVARDPAGHLQRLGPAVLATWDPATDSFEHYAWGISAELASRTGLRPGDVDGQLERRSSFLTGLAEAGIAGSNQLRTALDGFRLADSRESAG
jgi:hypothetical protein